ncbi:MAG: Phosphomannomutase [Candidatus Wolfebacteria bacterium GW2011_GWC1_37_10]|uniref:Phosphomannomutase n=1 Tax=Candidatus Wolfebacteria bacterium GW2011_GWC1_37_10 TaxID=1619010 RepID=A0A0G0G6Z5_9BACT|nr:MAG: Phosphomannomutase [Candidatus Wolfebacteria bacterium GW2011_GWC1_37_10]
MDYLNLYSDFLKKFFNPQKPLKVIFDCSNGTTGPILKKLTDNNQRLKTFFINDNPNGNFPAHSPNPLEKNSAIQLQKEVKKQKSDLGIIFDADGDRVIFVDNKARIVNPEIISRLLIWYLKPNKIIITPSTGWLIKKINNHTRAKDFINKQETRIKIIKSKIGHYYIKKIMFREKADFAFEQSGHYYFAFKNLGKDGLYYDSGIMAAIEIINAVSQLPYSLADFNDLLPQYHRSGEINIKIKNGNLKIRKIERYFKASATKISHLDGLTMEFNPPAGGWWFNLRPSNTESLLRLNIEAVSKSKLDKIIKKLQSLK